MTKSSLGVGPGLCRRKSCWSSRSGGLSSEKRREWGREREQSRDPVSWIRSPFSARSLSRWGHAREVPGWPLPQRSQSHLGSTVFEAHCNGPFCGHVILNPVSPPIVNDWRVGSEVSWPVEEGSLSVQCWHSIIREGEKYSSLQPLVDLSLLGKFSSIQLPPLLELHSKTFSMQSAAFRHKYPWKSYFEFVIYLFRSCILNVALICMTV